ncbi:NADH:flavin oxidoreductase [Halospeciosus flavus]|uniref:NADH:flavin oxidoreductase n=1 Tax=Halospeciosus flavus TaxID=3032283 RepID=A0ABD5Z5D8_9EURY|nr:NADH:flavin oxidoreductase [Halospeciosus flavus]
MPDLDDPVSLGGVDLPNRLYRAPLLECAGNGPDAAETLVDELEPAAESGVGLVCQGATIVRGEGGCAAPNMTRVHDPAFVADLDVVPEAVESHGGRVFAQLEHGGLRSMETWHAAYHEDHPDLEQLAVSEPPRLLRALDRTGFLDYDPHVLTTDEVSDLAADFGRAAERLVDAGYHGIHVAGANMGIVQQFLSPYYNRRDDEFADGFHFLERLHDEIRDRVGDDVPIITKIPAETEVPPFVRRHLSLADGVDLCERAAAAGFDALVPVTGSTFWDTSLIRGAFPERAWRAGPFESGYEAAFGGPLRWRLIALANWVEARRYDFEPAWNADFCRRVREQVDDDVPVMLEGGVRERTRMDALLGDACDLVGVGRPFYAEPRLGAELLDESGADAVACENCNNCVVPQATGAEGVCRTPAVRREAARRRRERETDRES